jgi:hypothetical protein
MTSVVSLSDYRRSPLDRAGDALALLRAVEASNAEWQERRAAARVALRDTLEGAAKSMRTMGPCPWTDAAYRRAAKARTAYAALDVEWSDRLMAAVSAKSAAGAALAPLERPAARRLYADILGAEMTPQKVGARVHDLLCRHRQEMRHRRVAQCL